MASAKPSNYFSGESSNSSSGSDQEMSSWARFNAHLLQQRCKRRKGLSRRQQQAKKTEEALRKAQRKLEKLRLEQQRLLEEISSSSSDSLETVQSDTAIGISPQHKKSRRRVSIGSSPEKDMESKQSRQKHQKHFRSRLFHQEQQIRPGEQLPGSEVLGQEEEPGSSNRSGTVHLHTIEAKGPHFGTHSLDSDPTAIPTQSTRDSVAGRNTPVQLGSPPTSESGEEDLGPGHPLPAHVFEVFSGYKDHFNSHVTETPHSLEIYKFVPDGVVTKGTVEQLAKELFERMNGREGAITIQAYFLLRNVETGKLRFYYASHNSSLVKNRLFVVGGTKSYQNFLSNIKESDFFQPISKYIVHRLNTFSYGIWALEQWLILDMDSSSGSESYDDGEALSQTAEDEVSVEVPERLFVKKSYFLSLSPASSFYACIAATKLSFELSKSLAFVADRYGLIRRADQLMCAISERLGPNRKLFSRDGKFNYNFLPIVRETVEIRIEIWNPDTRRRLSKPSFDFGLDEAHYALFGNSFCPIKYLSHFRQRYHCQHCYRVFSTASHRTRHETGKCGLLKFREAHPGEKDSAYWFDKHPEDRMRFSSGKYRMHKTIPEAISHIGLTFDPDLFPVNKEIAAYDIETLNLDITQLSDTIKTSLETRTIPCCIAIASSVPGFERAQVFIAKSQHSDFLDAAVGYLMKISKENYKNCYRRCGHIIKELFWTADNAKADGRLHFAKETKSVAKRLVQSIKRLNVVAWNGAKFDLPMLSRTCGLPAILKSVDNKTPTVVCRNADTWLALNSQGLRFLDLARYQGASFGTLRSFLKNITAVQEQTFFRVSFFEWIILAPLRHKF